MNCTPFVRQYDILSNKWGDLLCQEVLFGRLIWIFGRSLKLIVRRTPLSALDSAGGALIGFVTGVAFVCILLIVLQWLFPITYTSLGYLSPERVKHTLLLKQLVDALPIAI